MNEVVCRMIRVLIKKKKKKKDKKNIDKEGLYLWAAYRMDCRQTLLTIFKYWVLHASEPVTIYQVNKFCGMGARLHVLEMTRHYVIA